MAATFTGADLRDWHAATSDPESHAILHEALEGAPVISWELAASELRDVLEDPAWTAEHSPETMTALLRIYLNGVVTGGKSAREFDRAVA